jgi:hypothetical protein
LVEVFVFVVGVAVVASLQEFSRILRKNKKKKKTNQKLELHPALSAMAIAMAQGERWRCVVSVARVACVACGCGVCVCGVCSRVCGVCGVWRG